MHTAQRWHINRCSQLPVVRGGGWPFGRNTDSVAERWHDNSTLSACTKLDDGDFDEDDNAFVGTPCPLACPLCPDLFSEARKLTWIFKPFLDLKSYSHWLHSDDNAFASVRLLAHSIPIVSQRLENGPVAICVRTYRLQVRIIKLEPLSPPLLSFAAACRGEWRNTQTENGEILELKIKKSQTEIAIHLVLPYTSREYIANCFDKFLKERNLSTCHIITKCEWIYGFAFCALKFKRKMSKIVKFAEAGQKFESSRIKMFSTKNMNGNAKLEVCNLKR